MEKKTQFFFLFNILILVLLHCLQCAVSVYLSAPEFPLIDGNCISTDTELNEFGLYETQGLIYEERGERNPTDLKR